MCLGMITKVIQHSHGSDGMVFLMKIFPSTRVEVSNELVMSFMVSNGSPAFYHDMSLSVLSQKQMEKMLALSPAFLIPASRITNT